MRAVVAFGAMGVLVVVIGVATKPLVLVLSAVALFGAVLLLGPVPTGASVRHRGAGAAVPGSDQRPAAVGDGRPSSGGVR